MFTLPSGLARREQNYPESGCARRVARVCREHARHLTFVVALGLASPLGEPGDRIRRPSTILRRLPLTDHTAPSLHRTRHRASFLMTDALHRCLGKEQRSGHPHSARRHSVCSSLSPVCLSVHCSEVAKRRFVTSDPLEISRFSGSAPRYPRRNVRFTLLIVMFQLWVTVHADINRQQHIPKIHSSCKC